MKKTILLLIALVVLSFGCCKKDKNYTSDTDFNPGDTKATTMDLGKAISVRALDEWRTQVETESYFFVVKGYPVISKTEPIIIKKDSRGKWETKFVDGVYRIYSECGCN